MNRIKLIMHQTNKSIKQAFSVFPIFFFFFSFASQTIDGGWANLGIWYIGTGKQMAGRIGRGLFFIFSMQAFLLSLF